MSDASNAVEVKPGLQLGRYQLLVGIASGGMGTVWAGRLVGHMGFRRFVAVKTVLPEHASNTEFEQMFLDEARLAAMIQHPNVVAIYELAENNGVLYLAMEWVNGEALSSLRKMTPDKKLDFGLAARIVAEGCAGLHAAHELKGEDGEPLNVVHRDVSPHNLLVSVDGHVKVVDFGIAKARGQMQQKTTTGEVKGKLQYMAPEQLASNRVDRRADIFALGCVLYECTLGQGPFVGEGLSIMYKIMEGDVPPPKSIDPNYPDALEAVLMKALAKDPNQRYSTAEEFRVALEGWIASTGNAVTDLDVAAWVKTTAGGKLDERMKRVRDMCDRLDNGEIVTAADANLPANLMSNGGTQTNVRANDTDVAANSAVTNSGILVHDVPNAEGYDGMAPAYAAPAAPRFGAGLVAAIAVVVVALVGIGAVVVVSRASVPPSSAAAAPSVVTVQAPPQVPAVAPVPPPAQPAVAPTPAPAAAPAEAAPSKTSKTSKKKSKSAEASDTGDERPAPSPKKKAKVIDQENPF